MKKFLSTVLLLMLALTLTAAAATSSEKTSETKKPLRLARLPLIILSEEPDEDALAGLELKLSRAIHVPLNKTLNAIEYLPASEAAEQLQDIWSKLRKKDTKTRLQEALEELSTRMNADMVICPILRRYSQEVMIGSSMINGDNRMISDAEVILIVYEDDTKEVTLKKSARSYNGEESNWGTARFLADDCMSEVIAQTEIREKVLRRTPIAERKEVERTLVD